MPRQNRVNPFGEIIATPERGKFMGNRGVLRDDEGRIRRKWQGKRWLASASDIDTCLHAERVVRCRSFWANSVCPTT
jgi:glycine/D-amino acid oxidase-like deaminating enzyme